VKAGEGLDLAAQVCHEIDIRAPIVLLLVRELKSMSIPDPFGDDSTSVFQLDDRSGSLNERVCGAFH
jgi:hypothetical protein